VGEPGTVAPATRPAPQRDHSVAHPGSAQLFWAQVLGNAGIFVALLVISRALGPTGRGTIAFITVTAMLVARLARLGVSEATTVFAAQRPAERPPLLANVSLFATLGGMAGIVLVIGLLELVGAPAGVGGIELLAIAVGLLASALADAGYRFLLGCSRFRIHASVTIATAWLYPALVLAVSALFGLTVARAALLWAAVQVVRAIVLLAFCVREAVPTLPDLRLLRESLAFGLRAWVGTISDVLNERTDQILITLIATEATTGIYAVAVNASEVILYLPMATATALVPLVARSEARLRFAQTLRAFRSLLLVTIPSAAVAALLGPELIPLVFGSSFEPSVAPFLLLLPGAVGFAALAVFSNALFASGSPGLHSLGQLVALAVGLGLDFALIPSFGAAGAAAAASAAFLSGGTTALLLYYSRTRFAWRALVVPQAGDLDLLRGLAGPLLSRRTASGEAA
jgi:O-antigen/teichoic acid export membrane protein